MRQEDFLFKEVSINDYHFNVDMDIYEGRLIDVGEIMAVKVAKHAVESVGDNVLTPSPTIGLVVDE